MVLELADTISGRYRCLDLLAGFAGLRLGELLALRRRHFDLDEGSIAVTEQDEGSIAVTEQVVTLRGGIRFVTPPKSRAGNRTVALPKLVVEALSDHLKTIDDRSDALLFPSDSGGFLPASIFYKAWRATRDRCGQKGLHLHDLRHAAWTGATQRELMARPGHSSPGAAMRDQHATAERDRKIAAGLDVLIARAKGAGHLEE